MEVKEIEKKHSRKIYRWMIHSSDIKGEHMQDVIEAFYQKWVKE